MGCRFLVKRNLPGPVREKLSLEHPLGYFLGSSFMGGELFAQIGISYPSYRQVLHRVITTSLGGIPITGFLSVYLVVMRRL